MLTEVYLFNLPLHLLIQAALREIKELSCADSNAALLEELLEVELFADKGVTVTILGLHNSGKSVLLNAFFANT